jgi:hypothetical protein
MGARTTLVRADRRGGCSGRYRIHRGARGDRLQTANRDGADRYLRPYRRDPQYAFDTHYEIRKRSSGQIAATGLVVVVLFDWKAQTKVPVSDALRQKVRALQQET